MARMFKFLIKENSLKLPSIITICIIGFLSIILVSCNAEKQIKTEVDQNYLKLTKLVNVGMGIDEAADILKKNGFTVGEKHLPTVKKDYYQINVPLAQKMPKSATLAESTGKASDVRIYAIIRADLDNKITSISN